MRNPGVMPGFSFLCSKTFDIFYKLRYDIPVKAIYSWRKRVKKIPTAILHTVGAYSDFFSGLFFQRFLENQIDVLGEGTVILLRFFPELCKQIDV